MISPHFRYALVFYSVETRLLLRAGYTAIKSRRLYRKTKVKDRKFLSVRHGRFAVRFRLLRSMIVPVIAV